MIDPDTGKLRDASSIDVSDCVMAACRSSLGGIHGRVRAAAGELVCLHCQPPDVGDRAPDEVPYSYSYITIAEPLPAPISIRSGGFPVGQFVRIDLLDQAVTVTDIKIYSPPGINGNGGSAITLINAAVGSTASHCEYCHHAAFAIDGNFGTYVETASKGKQCLQSS